MSQSSLGFSPFWVVGVLLKGSQTGLEVSRTDPRATYVVETGLCLAVGFFNCRVPHVVRDSA